MSGPESLQSSSPEDEQKKWDDLLKFEGMPPEPKREVGADENRDYLDERIQNLRHHFMLYLASRDEPTYDAHVKAREELKGMASEFGFTSEEVGQYLDDEFIEWAADEITALETKVIESVEKLRQKGNLPHEQRLAHLIANDLTNEYPGFSKKELSELITPSLSIYLERISI